MPCLVFVETMFTHRPLGEVVVATLVVRNREMTRRVGELGALDVPWQPGPRRAPAPRARPDREDPKQRHHHSRRRTSPSLPPASTRGGKPFRAKSTRWSAAGSLSGGAARSSSPTRCGSVRQARSGSNRRVEQTCNSGAIYDALRSAAGRRRRLAWVTGRRRVDRAHRSGIGSGRNNLVDLVQDFVATGQCRRWRAGHHPVAASYAGRGSPRRHTGVRHHERHRHVRQRQPCRLRNGEWSRSTASRLQVVGHLHMGNALTRKLSGSGLALAVAAG